MLKVISIGAVCEVHDGLYSASIDHYRRTQRELLAEHLSNDHQSRRFKGRSSPRNRKRRPPSATSEGALIDILDPKYLRMRADALLSEIEIKVSEFADTDDGDRILLRDDRGWSIRAENWLGMTAQDFRDETLSRYGHGGMDPNGTEWLIDRFHTLGVDVEFESLRRAPYVVELGPFVLRMLQEGGSGAVPSDR